jgi:gamma-glutamyltranspeptidase/glutathione hydrolase
MYTKRPRAQGNRGTTVGKISQTDQRGRRMKTRICLLVLVAFFAPALQASGPGKAAIASAHYLATEAGHEILAKGGNAFDAAIAVSSVLAVVEQTSSGIGGGAFWVLHRASDGFETMIDAREHTRICI